MNQPGTYTGADGHTYRWRKIDHRYLHEHRLNETIWGSCGVSGRDIPTAKAALDALVSEEAGEWVLLPAPNREEPYIRISKDGQRVQERTQEGRWNDYDAWWIKAAYRKGREQAQQEASGLRDAARELVGLTFDILSTLGIQPSSYFYQLPFEDCSRLLIAAKTLEGKL